MNILLSNDDGYKSLGLKVLNRALCKFGNVITVSPHKDISASSSCLSVHSPVKIKKVSDGFYKVYGTPADCIHIGARGICKRYPDIVFSGINFGSNMGDDVVYSGTVGAAIEGRHARLGSYAISVTSKNPKYVNDLDEKVNSVLEFVFSKLKNSKAIFNINIPDMPFSKIKGILFSHLGNRRISMKPDKVSSKKDTQFNIGKVGSGILSIGTDFDCIKKGYISITPLSIDMTDQILCKKLRAKYDFR